MGAQITKAAEAARQCGGEHLNASALSVLEYTEVQELVLRVVHAPIDDSRGARLLGYDVGTELKVVQFSTVHELNTLGWRYQEKIKQQWPPSYRYQITKRSWQAMVVSDNTQAASQVCVLQMPSSPDERTLENAMADVEDSKVAAVYAQRFNLHQQNSVRDPADLQQAVAAAAAAHMQPEDDSTHLVEDGSFPTIKVAAPIACEVVASGYPSMVPVGAICTLAPYGHKNVQKYVFDGHSDEFSELPQAYFHYAAFTSGGKEYVCDIQGAEDEDGSFLIVDPCILKAGLPTVRDLIGVVANADLQGEHPSSGPTAARFDALHPRCTQACKVFDPQRRSALRNGKTGMCGMGACGLRFPK